MKVVDFEEGQRQLPYRGTEPMPPPVDVADPTLVWRRTKAFLVFTHGLVLVLLLIPLMRVVFPPVLDYYSHLTRVYILQHLRDFAEYYLRNPVTPPNVGMDVVVGGLLSKLSLENGGWVFLASLLVMQGSGLYVLNRQLFPERDTRFGPLIGCIFVYQWVFAMGFLNYLLGVALSFWFVALRLYLQTQRVSTGAILMVDLVVGTLLFFVHLIAFLLHLAVVAGLQGYSLWQRRCESGFGSNVIVHALPLLVLLIPVVMSTVTGSGIPSGTPVYPQYDFLGAKLGALARAPDMGAGYAATLMALICVSVWILATGRIVLHPRMVLPLLLVLLLFIVTPREMGDAVHLDERIPIAFAWLLAASTRIKFPGRQTLIVAGTLVLALTLVRVSYLVPYFSAFDGEVKQELLAFNRLQAPGGMLVAKDGTADDGSGKGIWSLPTYVEDHVVSLASTRVPIFVATTHAIPSQHLVVPVGPPFTDLYGWQLSKAIPVNSATQLRYIIEQYRDLFQRRPEHLYLALLKPRLTASSDQHHDVAELALTSGKVLYSNDSLILVELA